MCFAAGGRAQALADFSQEDVSLVDGAPLLYREGSRRRYRCWSSTERPPGVGTDKRHYRRAPGGLAIVGGAPGEEDPAAVFNLRRRPTVTLPGVGQTSECRYWSLTSRALPMTRETGAEMSNVSSEPSCRAGEDEILAFVLTRPRHPGQTGNTSRSRPASAAGAADLPADSCDGRAEGVTGTPAAAGAAGRCGRGWGFGGLRAGSAGAAGCRPAHPRRHLAGHPAPEGRASAGFFAERIVVPARHHDAGTAPASPARPGSPIGGNARAPTCGMSPWALEAGASSIGSPRHPAPGGLPAAVQHRS